jgi:hypothetical protein
MTPDTRLVIGDFAGRIMQVLAPDLKSPFLYGTASLMAATLGMMVEEWDRGADRLAEENTAIRALFVLAAPLAPGGLSARLTDLSMTVDSDLKVSTLQAANNILRAALIDLQTWSEEQTGEAVTALNDAIWAELVQSTERRRFSATPF